MIFNEKITMKKRFKRISALRVTLSVSILVSVIATLLVYSVGHIIESIQFPTALEEFPTALEEPATILSLILVLVSVIFVFGNIIRMKSRKKITELESLLEKSDRELLESIESNTLSLFRERRNLDGRYKIH